MLRPVKVPLGSLAILLWSASCVVERLLTGITWAAILVFHAGIPSLVLERGPLAGAEKRQDAAD